MRPCITSTAKRSFQGGLLSAKEPPGYTKRKGGENVSMQACLQDRVNEAELSTAAYQIRKALREVLNCLSEEAERK